MNDGHRGFICFVLIAVCIMGGWQLAALIAWCGCAAYAVRIG